jgi:hypothetical protein
MLATSQIIYQFNVNPVILTLIIVIIITVIYIVVITVIFIIIIISIIPVLSLVCFLWILKSRRIIEKFLRPPVTSCLE